MGRVARRVMGLLLLVFIPLAVMGQEGRAVVADSVTGEPLSGATVLDKNGRMLGVTSGHGELPYIPAEAFPVSIRFMGYATIKVKSPVDGKLLMSEVMSELPEVVVEAKKQQVLHMLGYVREYSTLTTYSDTVFLFREKMVDFMVPLRKAGRFKGWTNQRLLKSKSYYHLRNSQGIDSVSDNFPEHFSWADWIGIMDRMDMPLNLQGTESATDTVKGRYGTSMLWRRSSDRMYLDIDILADTANYRFVPSLKGFLPSMDFRRLNIRYVYDDVSGGAVLPDNLSSMSFNVESSGRGRNLKRILHAPETPYVETYVEMYIIDKEYITVKEARRRESKSAMMNDIQVKAPDGITPLSPYVEEVVYRVENIDRDGIRLAIKPDERMISHTKKRKRGFLSRLKSMFGL